MSIDKIPLPRLSSLGVAWPPLRRALRKKRRLLMTLGILAFALALAAALAPPSAATHRILVATRPIAQGEEFTVHNTALIDVPRTLSPEGALTSLKSIAGSKAAISISRGLPLTTSLFAAPTGVSPGEALAALDIGSSPLGEIATTGRTLEIACDSFVTGELHRIRVTIHTTPTQSQNPSTAGPFGTVGTQHIVVRGSLEDIRTIAHCTPDTPPFVSVVG